jgi:hypothetical protein
MPESALVEPTPLHVRMIRDQEKEERFAEEAASGNERASLALECLELFREFLRNFDLVELEKLPRE